MLDIDSAISKFKTSIHPDRTSCSARKQGKKAIRGIAYAECGEILFIVNRAGHKYGVEGLFCYCECKHTLFYYGKHDFSSYFEGVVHQKMKNMLKI